jgi:hypothetical protein
MFLGVNVRQTYVDFALLPKRCRAGAFATFSRSEQVLHLEFLASDSGRIVPVYLSRAYRAITQPHTRNALAFAPIPWTAEFPQPVDFTNTGASRKGFRVGDFAQNLKVHYPMVSEPAPVNYTGLSPHCGFRTEPILALGRNSRHRKTKLPPRISIFTLGSRGDTQPFCVLGRALLEAGYDVTLCTPEPYRPFVESFGLKLRPIGTALAGLKDSDNMNALVRGGINRFVNLPAFFKEARGGLVDFLTECWRATENSDCVVFIPTTFFVADFARMRGIKSVRVALQPVLPTSKQATALFGSTNRGAFLNRLSYEIPRIASPIPWSGSAGFKAATGRRLQLGVLPNPMTFRASESLNLMAYSAALFPDPGDWPFEAKITGAWFYDAEPHLALAAEIEDFSYRRSGDLYRLRLDEVAHRAIDKCRVRRDR